MIPLKRFGIRWLISSQIKPILSEAVLACPGNFEGKFTVTLFEVSTVGKVLLTLFWVNYRFKVSVESKSDFSGFLFDMNLTEEQKKRSGAKLVVFTYQTL